MKIVLSLLFLTLILLLQNIIEAISYQVYRAMINDNNFFKFVELVFRYFIYRFTLTVIPYIILIWFVRSLFSLNLLTLIVVSGIINLAIAAFIGLYIEGQSIFDTSILICSVISSIVVVLFFYFLNPTMHHLIKR
jgi:hypothetical protein